MRFNIGDRVKIVRVRYKPYHYIKPCTSEMLKTVGKVGKIIDIDEDIEHNYAGKTEYEVTFEDDTARWYVEECLIKDKPRQMLFRFMDKEYE